MQGHDFGSFCKVKIEHLNILFLLVNSSLIQMLFFSSLSTPSPDSYNILKLYCAIIWPFSAAALYNSNAFDLLTLVPIPSS